MKVSSIFSKLAVNLCRLVLALTFIFSGYVKAIDPLGTQYKIVDYLKALHLEWIFPDWSTLLASILLSTMDIFYFLHPLQFGKDEISITAHSHRAPGLVVIMILL